MKYKIGAALFAVALIAGCGKVEQFVAAAEKAEALEQRVAALEKEVSDQKEGMAFWASRVGDLDVRLRTQAYEARLESEKWKAVMTPQDDGSKVFLTKIGPMMVLLKDIKPYASGTKAVLNFGNPLAASLSSIEFDIEWQAGTGEEADRRTKQISYATPIIAGSWQSVPVVLDGIKPDKLSFVTVSNFKPNVIHLEPSQQLPYR